MVQTGAVIVAAGLSKRMGEFKPLLKVGNLSMIERIITNFQQAEVHPIVVVTGYQRKELEKKISHLGVICISNEKYASTEMFDSAKLGFEFIKDKCERTFFTPADIPLFTKDTVIKLMESTAPIVKPSYGGAGGHPIIITCCLIEQLLEVGGNEGLRKALSKWDEQMELVEVEDEGILFDADTKEEFHWLIKKHNQQLYRPCLTISLVKEGKIFDKDSAMLLHMIECLGTVKDACEKIGISYSKAWKMLKTLEENLGFPLIERMPGGEYGGASHLTEEGREMLKRYEKYVEDVKNYANIAFEQYMRGGSL